MTTWDCGRRFAMLVLMALLSGCATAPARIRLEPGEVSRLQSESEITIVHYATPPFPLRDPTSEARWGMVPIFGIVGANAAAQRGVEEGERIRVQYGLEDPVARVRERLVAGLKNDLALQNVRVAERRFMSTDNVEELKRTFGATIVIDFRTGWGASAVPKLVPFTAERYQVAYAVRSRLIRLGDGKTLWQGLCTSLGREPKGKWTLEELTADGAALLKGKINEAAELCAEDLVTQLSGKERKPAE